MTAYEEARARFLKLRSEITADVPQGAIIPPITIDTVGQFLHDIDIVLQLPGTSNANINAGRIDELFARLDRLEERMRPSAEQAEPASVNSSGLPWPTELTCKGCGGSEPCRHCSKVALCEEKFTGVFGRELTCAKAAHEGNKHVAADGSEWFVMDAEKPQSSEPEQSPRPEWLPEDAAIQLANLKDYNGVSLMHEVDAPKALRLVAGWYDESLRGRLLVVGLQDDLQAMRRRQLEVLAERDKAVARQNELRHERDAAASARSVQIDLKRAAIKRAEMAEGERDKAIQERDEARALVDGSGHLGEAVTKWHTRAQAAEDKVARVVTLRDRLVRMYVSGSAFHDVANSITKALDGTS